MILYPWKFLQFHSHCCLDTRLTGKPTSRGRRKKTQSQQSGYDTISSSTRTTRSRSRTRGGKKKENEVIEIDDSSSDEGDDTSTSEVSTLLNVNHIGYQNHKLILIIFLYQRPLLNRVQEACELLAM